MLRLSNLRTDVQRANTSLVAPMQVHVEQLTHDLIRRASEFATHAKRQRVQLNDVVQAASAICLTCAKYDNTTQTCTVYNGTGGKRRGGGTTPSPSENPNACGSAYYRSQCRQVHTHTCVSAGGRRRRRRSRHKANKGGIYTGFCGGTENLTQCMNAIQMEIDGQPAPVCYGSGKRRTGATRTHRRRQLRAKGKGGRRTLRNQHTAATNSYLTKSAVYNYAKQRYNVQWTPDALSFLDNALKYHVTNVLHEARSDSYYATSSVGALSRVLRTYQQDG